MAELPEEKHDTELRPEVVGSVVGIAVGIAVVSVDPVELVVVSGSGSVERDKLLGSLVEGEDDSSRLGCHLAVVLVPDVEEQRT